MPCRPHPNPLPEGTSSGTLNLAPMLEGKRAKVPVTINTPDVANHRRLIGRNGLLHTLFKGRHDLCGKPLPLLQHHGMRGADRVTHGDAIESGVTLLQAHQLLDHELGWTTEEGPLLDRLLKGWQAGGRRSAGVSHGLDLRLRKATDQSQRPEHFQIFFVVFGRRFDALLLGLGQAEMEAYSQILAQLHVATDAAQRIPIAFDNVMHGATFGHATADHALDAVLCHEIQAARRGALDRLPTFDRAMDGLGHQGELLQFIATIVDARWNGVICALMGEGWTVERFINHLNLFLEQVAIGWLVTQGGPKGLDLARVIATPHAKDDPPAGQDVGSGKILGQPQRMPHRGDIEATPELQASRDMCQVHGPHQKIRDTLIALRLKMVLSGPKCIVPYTLQQFRNVAPLVEDRREVFVRETAVVHRSTAIANIIYIDMAGV